MSRKMKDSNIYYLNNIPKDWKIAKYKIFSKSRMGETILAIDTEKEGIPIYSATQDNKIFGYTNSPKIILKKGDLVIPARGNSIGCVSYINDEKATCTQTTICSYDIHNINNKFYYYVILGLNDEWFRYDGSAIPQITVEQVKNNYMPVPSIVEQEKIANYLDKEVGKINRLIEDNKKIIELIEEYKNQYLEKKFDEISDESNKIRLKYLGNLQNGISAGAEKFGKGKGTFINYGDVYNYDVIPHNPKGIIELNEKEIEKYSLKRGDILFTRTSETIEEVGISAVCTKDYPNSAFSGFVIRFRPFNTEIMLPDFYKYYFKLKTHRDYFAREMNLVTRASLSQGLLGDIKILVPSIRKQNIIANKIDKKFDSLNTTINYRKQIIEKLEEYKKSLIYEVVTGKVEVKG